MHAPQSQRATHDGHRSACLNIHTVMQGRFKQPLPFDSVLSGQCFSGPLQHMPASWLTSMIFKLVHQINPSIFVGSVDAPSLLAPIVSMAQCVSVAVPGTEPSLDASPIEDMRLLGAAFQMPSGSAAHSVTCILVRRAFQQYALCSSCMHSMKYMCLQPCICQCRLHGSSTSTCSSGDSIHTFLHLLHCVEAYHCLQITDTMQDKLYQQHTENTSCPKRNAVHSIASTASTSGPSTSGNISWM